jgi:hypothetical protein
MAVGVSMAWPLLGLDKAGRYHYVPSYALEGPRRYDWRYRDIFQRLPISQRNAAGRQLRNSCR